MLLRRPEREHDPVVAREVLLELHPVAVPDAHRASLRREVGTGGFEPPASASQTRHSDQAELRPVAASLAL